jgi:hypothetical protein
MSQYWNFQQGPKKVVVVKRLTWDVNYLAFPGCQQHCGSPHEDKMQRGDTAQGQVAGRDGSGVLHPCGHHNVFLLGFTVTN